MHRLFVAIRPPAAMRARLLSLMGGIAGARWQDDDQLHLTLRFIGAVDRHHANNIVDALRAIRFAPFDLGFSGFGCFDRKRRIDSLWIGAAPREPLIHLHAKVDRACVLAGLPPDERAYLPHVTLARFGRSGGSPEAFLASNADFATRPFTVSSFALFESQLSQDRATYHLIEHYAGG